MALNKLRVWLLLLLVVLLAFLAYLLGPEMAVVLILPVGLALEIYWAFLRRR